MSRIMYDSTNPYDIPRTAIAVAGYVDGAYVWSQAGWDWHGAATKVRITVTGQTLDAHVADVENGDLTPAQGAAWCRRMNDAGKAPSLYFSLSRLGEIETAIRAAGVREYRQWIAKWDGRAVLDVGDAAKQYADSIMAGGHYDLSVLADYWPGVDPPPAAPGPVVGPVSPPPPILPPSPPPADAQAAQASFWDLTASLVGRGLPELYNAILAELRHLQDL